VGIDIHTFFLSHPREKHAAPARLKGYRQHILHTHTHTRAQKSSPGSSGAVDQQTAAADSQFLVAETVGAAAPKWVLT